MKTSIVLCTEPGCNDSETTCGYCRVHYIKNWKKTKERECKKTGTTLENYIKKNFNQRLLTLIEGVGEPENKNKKEDKDGTKKDEFEEIVFSDLTLEDIFISFSNALSEDIDKLFENIKVIDD